MKLISATVISNSEPMPGVHLISVDAPNIVSTARAGQFVMVNCGHTLILRRPLSIHQVINSNQLHLLFSVAGKGTLWLSQRQEEETLDLLGPLGNGFAIDAASQNLLLIAGGIGIAPLAFLAQQALGQEKSVILLSGASTTAQLYPLQLLPGEIRTAITTEDGSSGRKGMITDILPDFIDWADQIYACGPLAMYQEIAMQRYHAKKPIQISLEVRLGCGLGACYGCSIKTRYGMKQVCHEGPVFDLEEIIWQEVKI